MSGGDPLNHELQKPIGPAEVIALDFLDADRFAAKLYRAPQLPQPDGYMDRLRHGLNLLKEKELRRLLERPKFETIDDVAERTATTLAKRHLAESVQVSSSLDQMAGLMRAAVFEASVADRFRIKAFGADYPTTASRAYSEHLISHTAFWMANHFFSLPERGQLIHTLGNFAQGIVKQPVPYSEWPASKMAQLAIELISAASILDIFMAQEPANDADAEQLKNEAEALWGSAQSLRRFGLKPAIAPTNLPGINGISMRPGFEMNEMIYRVSKQLTSDEHRLVDPEPTMFTLKGAVATIILTNLPLKRGLPQASFIASKDQKFSAAISFDQMVEADQAALAKIGSGNQVVNVQLRLDGHLYTLSGVSLDHWSAELGCQEAYQQVRLECLALYFDLVVPVYIQKLVKDAVGKRTDLTSSADRLIEMAIARRRLIYSRKDEIIAKLKREMAEAHRHRQGRTKKHPVTGHVRELPREFSATLEARERALFEDERVLAEFGETWVKYHERGSVGSVETVKVKPVRGIYRDRQRARRK